MVFSLVDYFVIKRKRQKKKKKKKKDSLFNPLLSSFHLNLLVHILQLAFGSIIKKKKKKKLVSGSQFSYWIIKLELMPINPRLQNEGGGGGLPSTPQPYLGFFFWSAKTLKLPPNGCRY